MLASWRKVMEYTHLAECKLQPVSKYVGQLAEGQGDTHLAGCKMQPVPQNVCQLAQGQGVHSPGWL